MESVVMLLFYSVTMILVSQIFYKTSLVKAFCLAAIIAGVVVCITAIGFSKGEYISFFAKIPPMKQSMGPFLNRNHGGMFLAVTFFISLGYTCAGFFDKEKFLNEGRRGEFYIRQAVFIFVSISLFYGVIYSNSRGAVLCTIAVSFLFLLIYFFISPFSKLKKIALIALTLAAFLLTGLLVFKNLKSLNKWAQRSSGISETIRKDLYTGAYYMLKDQKFTGVGLGAFSVGIVPYVGTDYAYPLRLHSDWLELALGIGMPAAIIVFGLIFVLIAVLVYRLLRLKKRKQMLFLGLSCALAVMCAGSFIDFHFYVPANAFLFFCVCGLLCCASFNKNTVSPVRLSIFIKTAFCIVLLFALHPFTMKTIAWREFLFGKGMAIESRVIFYQRGLSAYQDPLYALRSANACLLASRDKSLSEEKRLSYKDCARDISGTYLSLYPFMGGFNVIYSQIL
ncbi:O-antigen ligase [Elusimicrobium posterum]|uniref:O-antigen ligase family protein n=1 Tax=Elusimicrobium posterum TaxID=3116653 RepID=UPI003C771418